MLNKLLSAQHRGLYSIRGPAVQIAPPAFLPVPGSLGLYQQGHGLTVFLNSRGEATAYDPHGEQMWQVSLPFPPQQPL